MYHQVKLKESQNFAKQGESVELLTSKRKNLQILFVTWSESGAARME